MKANNTISGTMIANETISAAIIPRRAQQRHKPLHPPDQVVVKVKVIVTAADYRGIPGQIGLPHHCLSGNQLPESDSAWATGSSGAIFRLRAIGLI